MRRVVSKLVLMITLAMTAGPAIAATVTTTLPISLTVGAGTCSVSASGVNFGTIPASGSVLATGTITVNCQSGVAYSVSMDAGSNFSVFQTRAVKNTNGTDLTSYELYKDSARTQIWGDSGFANTYTKGSPVQGTGSGNPQPLTVFGGASGSSFLQSGTYSDSVLVTVNF